MSVRHLSPKPLLLDCGTLRHSPSRFPGLRNAPLSGLSCGNCPLGSRLMAFRGLLGRSCPALFSMPLCARRLLRRSRRWIASVLVSSPSFFGFSLCLWDHGLRMRHCKVLASGCRRPACVKPFVQHSLHQLGSCGIDLRRAVPPASALARWRRCSARPLCQHAAARQRLEALGACTAHVFGA